MDDRPGRRPAGPALHRLNAILDWLERKPFEDRQLNLATFFARSGHPDSTPIGCVLGHWAALGLSSSLTLYPIRFTGQIKSPVMMRELFDDYMSPEWKHFTLCYRQPTVEAYGETAAMLYLRLGKWDLHRLFYPAGASYEIRQPVDSVLLRLRQMVRTT
jgi:hypothetical protein